jgi:transposase InsO family protein
MQRRLSLLAGFQFRIMHISGKSEDIAISDFLSRWGPFETKTTNAQTQTYMSNDNKQSCFRSSKIKDFKQKITSVNQSTQTLLIDKEQGSNQLIDNTDDSESDSDLLEQEYNRHGFQESENDAASHNDSANLQHEFQESEEDTYSHIDSVNLQQVLLQNAEKETDPITLYDIREEYRNDKILMEVMDWVNTSKKPNTIDSRSSHRETFHYWKNFNLLTVRDGILYMKRINVNTKKYHKVIVLPFTLIQRALYSYHNTISNCHPGVENSYDICSKKFYFYKMRKEFEMWINACLVCNKTKQTKAFRRAPLRPITYNHPFQAISIDHLEVSKTPTPRGNRALLTITDMFSSYLVCVPVKSTKTEVTVQKILEHWVLRFGLFNTIHHDLGSGFTSQLFKAILKVFNVKDKPGTSFHSQTQGKIESQNRRLNMCYRACLSDKDFKNYDLYAKYITFVLNSLKSSRTGYSAHYLVHGHEPTMPRDLFIKDNRLEELQSDNNKSTAEIYAYQMYKQVREITRRVISNTKQQANYMSTQYDKRVRGPFFEKGQYCFILVNVPSHKYSEKWTGPYLITYKINNWNYIVNVNGLEKVVNIEKMKEYKLSKYSVVNNKSTKSTTTVPDSSNPPSKQKSRLQEDSDSDTEITISIETPNSSPLTTNHSHADNTVVQHDVHSDFSDSDQQNIQPLSDSENYIPESPDIISLPGSPASTPAQSESDSEDSDDREALLDANTTVDVNTSTGNQPGSSMGRREVTLPEIDRYGKRKGIRVPQITRDLSRSEAEKDLTTITRSNPRYGIRPRVKEVKRYGISSPLKTLKKKVTKEKTSRK